MNNYRLNCEEQKVRLLNNIRATIDGALGVGVQATQPHQDDWDDALRLANEKMDEARRLIAQAHDVLIEGC